MKTWIKAEFEFQERAAVLTIGRYQVVRELTDLFTDLKQCERDDASRLEPILLAAIVRLRPDLAGCTLIGFKYDLAAMRWEILASHSSFPKVAWGDEAPRMPLSRDDKSRPKTDEEVKKSWEEYAKGKPPEGASERAKAAVDRMFAHQAQAVLDDLVEREKVVAEIVNAAIVKHRQSGPLPQADEPDAITKKDHRLVTFG